MVDVRLVDKMRHLKPRLVRVSYGSAVVLGLARGWLKTKPTTSYLLTYLEERCLANCGFCPQAKDSNASLNLLSRVEWPPYPAQEVVERAVNALRRGLLKRACVQVVNRPEGLNQALWLVEHISLGGELPVSVSIPPLGRRGLEAFKRTGAGRVSIALDAANRRVFDEVKGLNAGGPYTWDGHWKALRKALEVFGPGNVTTHLIVGLGETERDLARVIDKLLSIKVLPALFAFTPIPGTRLEALPQPEVASYRRIQLVRHLLVKGIVSLKDLEFNHVGRLVRIKASSEEVMREIESGEPFETSGCPGCNRPFYNEKPGGPLYNYPRPLSRQEVEEALSLLRDVVA
ncbi:MAG: radical SAM protein [Thermoprotei archaeon]|nr:MAG: radical SAM protein [Thermoprotei archaeon]